MVKKELTWDKFIFGLIDDKLKKHLLFETDLTLECAVALVQCSEASKIQVKSMASGNNPKFTCDEVKKKKITPCVHT